MAERKPTPLEQALLELAAEIPFGALMAETDPPGFIRRVTEELRRLKAAVVRHG